MQGSGSYCAEIFFPGLHRGGIYAGHRPVVDCVGLSVVVCWCCTGCDVHPDYSSKARLLVKHRSAAAPRVCRRLCRCCRSEGDAGLTGADTTIYPLPSHLRRILFLSSRGSYVDDSQP